MKKIKKQLFWIIPAALVIGLVIFSKTQGPESLFVDDAIGEKIANMGNRHIDSIGAEHESYNSNPPTSGPHVGNIAPWGVSKEIIPDELQIHNLEDGGVIIQYHADKISREDIETLETVVQESGRKHVIVAPRYDMEYAIALTAWNRLLPLDHVDQEKIHQFIAAYEGMDHHTRF
jgi:hypothetical protein